MEIDIIKGKSIHSIYRAADMLCLNIGEDIEIELWKSVQLGAEYSFHIQCPWVFRENSTLILGSSDIYVPYNKNVSENWSYDEMNRPDNESSIFDVKIRQLKESYSEWIIEKCYVDINDNLNIIFNGNKIFQTFISSSVKDEYWRFIDFHTRDI